jgi:microcystin-dependent protein
MYQTPEAEDVVEDVCYLLRFPGSFAFKGLVAGALASLIFESSWEADGTLSPQDTAQIFKTMMLNAEYRCMIGSIIPMATASVPDWALPCNGATYAKTTYPKLWEVLADVFKTETDFTLPDMRDKTVVGAKTGIGGSFELGDTGGEIDHTLTVEEMPEHSHDNSAHTHIDTGHSHSIPLLIDFPVVVPGEDPVGAQIVPIISAQTGTSSANLTSNSISIDPEGSGDPHNNMPPFMALHWVIVAR